MTHSKSTGVNFRFSLHKLWEGEKFLTEILNCDGAAVRISTQSGYEIILFKALQGNNKGRSGTQHDPMQKKDKAFQN